MNKLQRQERNTRIAKEYSEGAKAQSIADKYGIRVETVYKITKEAGIKRSKSIANEKMDAMIMQGSMDAHSIAEAFESSYAYVYNRARHLGVKLPRKKTVKRSPPKASKILYVTKRILDGDVNDIDISKELGCTRQYVELVRRQLEKVGILEGA